MLLDPLAEATDPEMRQHFRVEGALMARPSICEAKRRSNFAGLINGDNFINKLNLVSDMGKNRNRGLTQLIITILISIYLWAKVPSWEKMILEIIVGNPSSINQFGSYWIKIVYFLLQNWEIISFIILIENQTD